MAHTFLNFARAEGDALGATADTLYNALKGPKILQRFSVAEGAGEHCESGARGLFNQRMFDWLDPTIGRTPDA